MAEESDDGEEAPTLLEYEARDSRLSVVEKDFKKVPVTLIAGFLGSGKTTLLNQCIAQNENIGLKVALITNEFAETGGLEAAMLSSGSTIPNVIEMRNGCLCCSVKDELVQTVEALVQTRDIEAIIIELSGAANPGIVASRFWLDEALESRLVLDGIVCIVDATKSTLSAPRAQGGDEARRQLALADLVILTKCDLVKQIEPIRKLIFSLNPTARIVKAANGHPLDFNVRGCLLDAGYYSATIASKNMLSTPGSFQQITAPHATAFTAIRLEPPTPQSTITRQQLNTFLAQLLWESQDTQRDATLPKTHDDPEDASTVFRVKGLLHLSSSTFAIVQAVYDTFEITEEQPETAISNIDPFLVIIGIHLDKALISSKWQQTYSSIR
mmetsp:Transcript_9390/g.14445  ORF Transcript_9390/g.14445 Transcript_9390/m.14445 type:complete len:384 (-) Transcript_9390:2049-3200(-)|eukprot:CAMPEP_0197352210 /NCGR_PEP_ID=MMETSP0893-20130614/34986_1 /TAXON_ID=44058 ORGANISM="Aureoumbra lagunensis, Strain CCMP1510" /NCGR_SAMPLE_ID=MMETSP0893 /ASSEMBLY_ACC=CAM_ASM_000539 /LENGTH=383 /DNA_ID=CAMNT_0042866479 /DNA_START=25 /DNA_END=1176 /DNA_ORIENTATION=+